MSTAKSKDSWVRSSTIRLQQLLTVGDIHASKINGLIEIIKTPKESKRIELQMFGYLEHFLPYHPIITSQLTFAVNEKILLAEDHGSK